MSISGIDRVTFGVEDVETCRKFFLDFGLKLVREKGKALDFETMNGCEVFIRTIDDPSLPAPIEPGSTLREVIWSAENAEDLANCRKVFSAQPQFRESGDTVYCTDPNGVGVGARLSHKRELKLATGQTNTFDHHARVDMPSPSYDHAEPIEVGHVVFFTPHLAATTAFYQQLGFQVSDRYPERGHFMRTAERGGHHDVFLLSTPDGRHGLNHVAFAVRDIHEVFGGGMHMSRTGWKTQLGPGKHPVSSAIFWYFQSPAGALVEYYADEDILTEAWTARDFEPGPTVFAEWAIAGGIDGVTRRQAQAAVTGPAKGFITEQKG
jgi:catechol 2,3-dioxygenase-like lactoylglutathione lyase family enzyme